jgi:ABC-2 type transport system ATP-binding protein
VEDVLVLENVSKSYGAFRAVDQLSFRVPRGEVLGFIGPNGAGKTSTLRMVMGITFPDTGRLTALGSSNPLDVKDRIGYLPEERGLYRKMTAHETLMYLGRLKGLRGAELRQRIDDWLERVGLKDRAKARVEALSKGMQQKLQFAATLLHKPELIILDEPFSGLDPLNVDLLIRLMQDLRREGLTVIFSTHQMDTAERLCDRIVLINRGRKLIEGTLPEIRRQFSERVVIIEGEGEFERLSVATGVRQSRFAAGQARLELEESADPELLLREALTIGRITRFEVQRPDLQAIFVKLVGGDAGAQSSNGTKTRGAPVHA